MDGSLRLGPYSSESLGGVTDDAVLIIDPELAGSVANEFLFVPWATP